MCIAVKRDEFGEFLSNELFSVVRDESGVRPREVLKCQLLHNAYVAGFHCAEQFPGYDEAAAAVNDRNHVVWLAAYMDVCYVHMPVLVDLQRLHADLILRYDLRKPPSLENMVISPSSSWGNG